MGETRNLGIQYREEILVVVSRLYIYVLVEDNNQIDIYSKRTLVKDSELQIAPNVNQFILALGKLIMTEIQIKRLLLVRKMHVVMVSI